MIVCKCDTKESALLSEMIPFQGELKKRTDKDIDAMLQSILEDGLIMPFALWYHYDRYFILDGHGRYAALVKAALQDASILEQRFPCILIAADTEDEARKHLLQIVSTYGRISVPGVIKFAAPVVNYKAPIVMKANAPKVKYAPIEHDRVIVRLKVDKDKVGQLTALLKEVKGIELY